VNTHPGPRRHIGDRIFIGHVLVLRQMTVQHIKLETVLRCPCSTRRLIGRCQHDCLAGLARISPPEDAQPVALGSDLGALDTVEVAGKVRSGQAGSFDTTTAMAEGGLMAAHPGCLAGLAQAIGSRAARHLAVQPIAEPRAADQEVLALFRGLKSEDAAGSRISPASG